MGVGTVWNRALVYFGIVEEDEYWDDEAFDAEEELDRGYRERPNVRRLHAARRRGAEFDDWSEPEDTQRTAVLRPPGGAAVPSPRPPLEAAPKANAPRHLVLPRRLHDAES